MSDFPKKILSQAQLGGVAKNFLQFTLSADVTSTTGTFPVNEDPTSGTYTLDTDDINAGRVYMSIGNPLTDEQEVVRVTSVDSSNIYVARNVDGRNASVHYEDDYLKLCWPAELYNLITDVVNDIENELAFSATCAEDVEPYKCVTINSSGQMLKAIATAEATSYVYGITLDGFGAGSTGYALRTGIVQNTNWYYDSISKLWLSDSVAGELMTHPPDDGNYESINAMTIPDNKISFNPIWSSVALI